MRAHFPPYTKPESAYDSARLYREASEIAAAQDAKLGVNPRDDLKSVMADLKSDLHRAYENAKCRIDVIASKSALAELARLDQTMGLYDSPTTRDFAIGDVPHVRHSATSTETSQHPMAAEAERIATQGVGAMTLVATALPSDPYDDEASSGLWLSIADRKRLDALPPGTRIYAATPSPEDRL